MGKSSEDEGINILIEEQLEDVNRSLLVAQSQNIMNVTFTNNLRSLLRDLQSVRLKKGCLKCDRVLIMIFLRTWKPSLIKYIPRFKEFESIHRKIP